MLTRNTSVYFIGQFSRVVAFVLAIACCGCGKDDPGNVCEVDTNDGNGDTDGDSDNDTDGDSDNDSDGDSDNDTDTDSDNDSDSDTDSDTDGDTDTDPDAETESENAGSDDIDTDIGSDNHIDSDIQVDTNSDFDPDASVSTDSDVPVAHIIVSPVNDLISESGSSSFFYVVLGAAPQSNVVISLLSDDETEGEVTPNELTFTADNWNGPQKVYIRGLDDDLKDGNKEFAIVFASVISQDERYNGLLVDSVTVVNIDNESAGIYTSAVSGNTSEYGQQATFAVALYSEPTAPVVLTVASDNPDEGTVFPSTLTFSGENWNALQIVYVSGVNDNVADGNKNYSIQFTSIQSEDGEYNGMSVPAIEVTNIDNDTAGIHVGDISGDTFESGISALFSIVLVTKPTSIVTVNYESDDIGEGVTDANSLTFTPANWNAPQFVTVYGVDDDIADGNQPYAIAFSDVTSEDENYVGLAVPSVHVFNIDNDSPGFTVRSFGKITDENGRTAEFSIALNSKPSADVIVSFSSNDYSEGNTETNQITFTPDDWSEPQTAYVFGLDDEVRDGNQSYAIRFASTVSEDGNYAGIRPEDLQFINLDDDTPGFSVQCYDGSDWRAVGALPSIYSNGAFFDCQNMLTSEYGSEVGVSVSLNTMPSGDVTIHFASNDKSEALADMSSLTFSSENWNEPQTFNVIGQNDDIADGNQPYSIIFSLTTTEDPEYAAIRPANISLTNMDDDAMGLIVSGDWGATSEDDAEFGESSSSFWVRLGSKPSGIVVVNVESSDSSEGEAYPASLTFTTENWIEDQYISIIGVDDEEMDGDIEYNVVLSISDETEDITGYAELTSVELPFVNLDNEQAQGSFYGRVIDAVSGDSLYGVEISIPDYDLYTTSDDNGHFSFDGLSPGDYTVAFSLEGYNDLERNVTIYSGGTTDMGNVSMSEILLDQEVRIVLTWEPNRDLDFHIYTPAEEHISYAVRTGIGINLDRDDMECCGPETITISEQIEGVYQVYAHNYSADTSICETGASFQIYNETGLVSVIDILPGTCGVSDMVWYAFELNNGEIFPINEFSTDLP